MDESAETAHTEELGEQAEGSIGFVKAKRTFKKKAKKHPAFVKYVKT